MRGLHETWPRGIATVLLCRVFNMVAEREDSEVEARAKSIEYQSSVSHEAGNGSISRISFRHGRCQNRKWKISRTLDGGVNFRLRAE